MHMLGSPQAEGVFWLDVVYARGEWKYSGHGRGFRELPGLLSWGMSRHVWAEEATTKLLNRHAKH